MCVFSIRNQFCHALYEFPNFAIGSLRMFQEQIERLIDLAALHTLLLRSHGVQTYIQ